MLIINLKKNENNKFKGRFFKKQIRPDPFTRETITICGKKCTYLEFNEEALKEFNLERLVNTFKGQIIGTNDALEKIVPSEFRFDYRQYFKRALLSSLINNIEGSISCFDILIKDDDFCFNDEYLKLANSVKSFSLISEETDETRKLSDKCFIEFGNFIKVIAKTDLNADIIIDFRNLDEDCKILFLKQGREQILYPDPRYFTMKDELLPLVSMGIEARVLCAAFSVVP